LKDQNKDFYITDLDALDKMYPNLTIPYIEVSGKGWFPILHILFNYADEWNKTCPENKIDEKIEIQQIKEKYGSLRFYHFGGPNEFRGMVTMAEMMTAFMCEKCGSTKYIEECSFEKCLHCKYNTVHGWGKGKDE